MEEILSPRQNPMKHIYRTLPETFFMHPPSLLLVRPMISSIATTFDCHKYFFAIHYDHIFNCRTSKSFLSVSRVH